MGAAEGEGEVAVSGGHGAALEVAVLAAGRLALVLGAEQGRGKTGDGRLQQGDVDAVLLASPSAVQGLVNACGGEPTTYACAALIAIGPTTARAIEESGLRVAALADRPSTDATRT